MIVDHADIQANKVVELLAKKDESQAAIKLAVDNFDFWAASTGRNNFRQAVQLIDQASVE